MTNLNYLISCKRLNQRLNSCLIYVIVLRGFLTRCFLFVDVFCFFWRCSLDFYCFCSSFSVIIFVFNRIINLLRRDEKKIVRWKIVNDENCRDFLSVIKNRACFGDANNSGLNASSFLTFLFHFFITF